MEKRKVLLLEDNILFAQSIEDFLEEKNFIVDIATDGEKALQKSYFQSYDIYLLDINVPEINGIEFLKMLRKSGDERPTIFMTSYQDTNTLKKGYESGCDDYMKKPIDLEELFYRMITLLKKQKNLNCTVKLSENYQYNFKERVIYHKNKPLKLPLKVINLLELLLENNTQIVTKEQIIYKLWSISDAHSDGSIRVYINKLKNIIGKEKIENIKGIGYKLTIN